MTEYPIRVLSFGAGVQSSTLLRMAIAGDMEPVQHAVFADTGWEPKAVYQHMQQMRDLAEANGIEFHIVTQGNIREDALNPEKRFASMPLYFTGRTENDGDGMGRRQCTREYKLKPLQDKQRELAGLKKGQRCIEHRITTVIGISWDEAQRMKDPLFPWISNEYPLVDRRMTRYDCLRYNEERGFSMPPRSACIGCPYHNNEEWRHMKVNDPESWEDACDFDEQIRSNEAVMDRMYQGRAYLHADRIPLRVVDVSNEEDRGQLNIFGNECEGMCGI